jgi:hypothetical protein
MRTGLRRAEEDPGGKGKEEGGLVEVVEREIREPRWEMG